MQSDQFRRYRVSQLQYGISARRSFSSPLSQPFIFYVFFGWCLVDSLFLLSLAADSCQNSHHLCVSFPAVSNGIVKDMNRMDILGIRTRLCFAAPSSGDVHSTTNAMFVVTRNCSELSNFLCLDRRKIMPRCFIGTCRQSPCVKKSLSVLCVSRKKRAQKAEAAAAARSQKPNRPLGPSSAMLGYEEMEADDDFNSGDTTQGSSSGNLIGLHHTKTLEEFIASFPPLPDDAFIGMVRPAIGETPEFPPVVGYRPRSRGRRKTAVAFVSLLENGSGHLWINGRDGRNYLQNNVNWVYSAFKPLNYIDGFHMFDIVAQVHGGGLSGKAGAIGNAVAKEMVRINPEWAKLLLKRGLLFTDHRQKERKHYGCVGARAKRSSPKR
eukprot:GHVQ01013053.1.p1 GENE.GHVQ01013053.1~~GHVQ01013053.1.p1  ORF type:complete len:380 (-),score=25.37 GHVQ01013053.1:1414-2553(-)